MLEWLSKFWSSLVYATDRLGSDIARFCTDVLPVYFNGIGDWCMANPIVAGIVFLILLFVFTGWLLSGKGRKR